MGGYTINCINVKTVIISMIQKNGGMFVLNVEKVNEIVMYRLKMT